MHLALLQEAHVKSITYIITAILLFLLDFNFQLEMYAVLELT